MSFCILPFYFMYVAFVSLLVGHLKGKTVLCAASGTHGLPAPGGKDQAGLGVTKRKDAHLLPSGVLPSPPLGL